MSQVDTHSGPLGEVRIAGASKGVALTTTAGFTAFPPGTNYLTLMSRNAASAVVVRYALNPYLIVLKTTDSLAAASNLTDYSVEAQDNNVATSVTLSSLDTIANDNALYVGSHIPFRGVDIDVDAANGTGSVLTVKYWDGSAWSDISDTDGTISSAKTMAVDGTVAWTVPTDWVASSLVTIGDTTLGVSHLATSNIYWTRWEVSVALDSSVTLDHMLAMSRVTTYDEFPTSVAKELRIHQGVNGLGNVEALTDAGTANLIVSCATLGVGSRFKD